MVSLASHGPAMMRRSVICSSSESVRPHEPETQETLPSHGREELANGSAGRMTGARSGSARGRFQVIRDRMIVTSARVRLEFPILSGESAPPVWRQPNVDHVGSWRATAPRRPAAPSRHVCSVRCSTATRYPPNARRTEAQCTRLSVLARQAAVAVERLAASGRLPVACVAVSARQTAASVAVGRARGDHWPDERVALPRVVVVYPRGAEPGLARPARRRRRCLQGRPPVGAPRQPGSLLASSWRPRGRCPVAPARSEAEAAANAHIVVGDVSPDVVEIPTGLTPRAQVLQPRRLITASPVIPIGVPPLVVRSVQHTVGRSASQTVITAHPASAGAGNRTAE